MNKYKSIKEKLNEEFTSCSVRRPSAAINATITGVIDAGIESGRVGHVYGALNGIKGVLNENFVNSRMKYVTQKKKEIY